MIRRIYILSKDVVFFTLLSTKFRKQASQSVPSSVVSPAESEKLPPQTLQQSQYFKEAEGIFFIFFVNDFVTHSY
jgi:hypothetical protein